MFLQAGESAGLQLEISELEIKGFGRLPDEDHTERRCPILGRRFIGFRLHPLPPIVPAMAIESRASPVPDRCPIGSSQPLAMNRFVHSSFLDCRHVLAPRTRILRLWLLAFNRARSERAAHAEAERDVVRTNMACDRTNGSPPSGPRARPRLAPSHIRMPAHVGSIARSSYVGGVKSGPLIGRSQSVG